MLKGLTVVKVGGRELDDVAWVAGLAEALAAPVCGPVVLVHGGGKEVSALQARLGIVPEWRDGLRVTDPETLAVVAMVLSGLVNKRVVAALLRAGVRAAGISGEDDALLTAEPAAGGALGRTGAVTGVRPALVQLLLEAGITPVVSPLSRGPGGGALNVNADDAAAALAVGLGARRLLFVSDVAGVRLDDGVAAALDGEGIEAGIAAGVVAGGMAPKLRAAVRAAASVPEVRIGGVSLLTGSAGTRVVAADARVAGGGAGGAGGERAA